MTSGDETSQRIAARHEEVLGQKPRVPPLDRECVADEVRAATDRLRGAVVANAEPLPLNAIPEIMFTMCRYPVLWQKILDLSVQVHGPDRLLPARDRELAMLRTGWLCQAPYEFGEHVKHAKHAGITSDEIERVVTGSTAAGWDAHERAILQAAEELHGTAMVSDKTWAQLSERYDDAQLVELLVLIGQFTATAYFQNAMRLRLEPGNQGLAAR